ncbi:MAG: hypothetical protein GDA54_03520 [Alphaproteobacteria bacterium GM7ARS4]|nr:hypothetical protein [Alphaproteobacteria bacterium GM7ARS4]
MMERVRNNVTCPFCGLLCDDIKVRVSDDGLDIPDVSCVRAKQGFTIDESLGVSPRVGGKSVSYEEAMGACVDIVKASKRPLWGGMAGGMSSVKRMVSLAERSGGVIDHAGGDAYSAQVRAVQEKGWFTGTASELGNRTDVVVLLGELTDWRMRRLFERYIWRKEAIFSDRLKKRRVMFVGESWSNDWVDTPSGHSLEHIKVARADFPSCMGALRLLWAGQPVPPSLAESVPMKALERVIESLRQCSYGAIVWDVSALVKAYGEEEASSLVSSFARWTQEMNRDIRMIGFPLGGDGNIVGAGQIAMWQSGFPLRISYEKDGPHYDRKRFATRVLLEEKAVDALIWLSVFNQDIVPPSLKGSIPSIVIGRQDLALQEEPSVFLPVKITGVHEKGVAVRLDSVVSLPLHQLYESPLRSSVELLDGIREALG